MNSELQFRFARPPARYEEVRLVRSACILKRILFDLTLHNLPGISNSVRTEALNPAFVRTTSAVDQSTYVVVHGSRFPSPYRFSIDFEETRADHYAHYTITRTSERATD